MGGKGKDKVVEPDIVFDFSAMDPQSDEEKNIAKQIGESLTDGDSLLETLKAYAGCDEAIRKVCILSFIYLNLHLPLPSSVHFLMTMKGFKRPRSEDGASSVEGCLEGCGHSVRLLPIFHFDG